MDKLRPEMPSREDSHELPPAEVLAALYEEHARQVLAAAFRVTGSRQDAEDVLQTVFLRLMRRWNQLELGETVPGPTTDRFAALAREVA